MPVELMKVGDETRTVYRQLGGNVILADECTCRVNWLKHDPNGINFSVTPSVDCLVDEHNMKAKEISTGDAQALKTLA